MVRYNELWNDIGEKFLSTQKNSVTWKSTCLNVTCDCNVAFRQSLSLRAADTLSVCSICCRRMLISSMELDFVPLVQKLNVTGGQSIFTFMSFYWNFYCCFRRRSCALQRPWSNTSPYISGHWCLVPRLWIHQEGPWHAGRQCGHSLMSSLDFTSRAKIWNRPKFLHLVV